jgi:hypothetical protein
MGEAATMICPAEGLAGVQHHLNVSVHSAFGRSGKIAPHGSLALRMIAGAIGGHVIGEREQLFVSAVSHD